MLVLSLFPGIGLLDRAFEEEGFCVVRGPDLLWGGDIRSFHPPVGRFDGLIGGPPCQAYSQFRHINPHCGRHGDLIPDYERVVAEAAPLWFVMENVRAAPEPSVAGYRVSSRLLRDVWVGGVTNRLRRFSFGTRDGRSLPVEVEALHTTEPLQAVTSAGERVPVALNGGGKLKSTLREARERGRVSVADMCEMQGLPRTFFDESPFTSDGQRKALGNGVPLPMGRAVARAVKCAMGYLREAA